MPPSRSLPEAYAGLSRPAVLCTLVKVVGSAPQTPGAKMWVSRAAFAGSLGGGELERRVIEHARRLLESPRAGAELKEYVLCKEMGQCCGGRAQVFYEPIRPARVLSLFGAGHVGRAAAQVFSRMPFSVSVVDARPEWADKAAFPEDVAVACEDPLEHARSRSWGESDAVCIFTHSHDLDFELALCFLAQPLGYLGLIGSEHKADVFRARLKSRPEGEALIRFWDERMHCPMGIPLKSKEPKVIAVSVAAELLREWGLKDPQEMEGGRRTKEGAVPPSAVRLPSPGF
jgi:xanthine dehydrogenase accessory factor